MGPGQRVSENTSVHLFIPWDRDTRYPSKKLRRLLKSGRARKSSRKPRALFVLRTSYIYTVVKK